VHVRVDEPRQDRRVVEIRLDVFASAPGREHRSYAAVFDMHFVWTIEETIAIEDAGSAQYRRGVHAQGSGL
jgi:hypothetical protein